MLACCGQRSPAIVFAAAALGLAALCLAPGAVPPARASRSDYVGATACKGCHEEAYRIWQKSAHAKAAARLGKGEEPRCLACHTTGEAPSGPAYFAAVECEACHGPGAGYAAADIMQNPTLAGLLGLRDLKTPEARAALCAECHRASTALMPFDAEAAYRRIAH